MRGRYLGVHSDQGTGEPSFVALLNDAKCQFDLHVVFEGPNLILLADRYAEIITPTLGDTAIVGTVFTRAMPYLPVTRIDPALSAHMVATACDCLIDDYWGSYLALAIDADSGDTHIVRDPSGAVPCYRGKRDGFSYFASDADLILRLGDISGVLDWGFVAHHLCYPMLRTGRTCVSGIDMVLPGQAVTIRADGTSTERYAWSPWRFAHADKQFATIEHAVDAVGQETRRCVGAWSMQATRVLLELSGGLDSSVVAASIDRKNTDLTCITLASSEPDSDERRYARIMASHINAPLHEVMLDPSLGDLLRVSGRRTPFPEEEVLHQIIDDAIAEHGVATGADSFFSGGGGDNVFCYLGTASPAADILRTRGPSRAFFRSVGELAELYRCTTWTAARYAVRKALWARPIFWRREAMLLAESAIVREPDGHPWFVRPERALPGKLEHVVSIAYGQWATDGFERSRAAALRYPLLSQPLIELCLRVPSWMWLAEGRNRSVARDAFRADLPREIFERRTKGDFTGFMGEVYRRNLPLIRELLLDGQLAKNGLLDRGSVEAALLAKAGPRDTMFCRLLTLARAEVWAQSWKNPAALI